ncbi:hypothetical protein CAMRE0001_1538 [Campylobacter rectus RM3267]|uniref:Uncharacterized protein n=1 Tax=Campylobacter rectus RM3267 TaxID=553218 RepID=B9CZH9_CAMRE|nr:hypothetical protein CAMRE0001_1538 [Campylobacter rectus RM3267]
MKLKYRLAIDIKFYAPARRIWTSNLTRASKTALQIRLQIYVPKSQRQCQICVSIDQI